MPHTFKIRVSAFKLHNFGDGLRPFEPGKTYYLPLAFRDDPWIAQHAKIVPDSPDDPDFDRITNQMRPRREIDERCENEKAHAARLAEEKTQREQKAAEEKERQRVEKMHENAEITVTKLAEKLRSPAAEMRQPAEEPSIGRPKGSGSYDTVDAPLVTEMHNLILKKEVTSIAAAARKVVHKAAGTGDEVSRAKRLVTRYAERFGRKKKRKSRSRKSGK